MTSTRRTFASSLALSAMGCGLGALLPAVAQAQPATSSPAAESARQAPNTGAPQLEEIVVTAQRRSENLQEVPIAITAVTAKAAEQLGVTGTMGLQVLAPAVSINQTAGGATLVTIRGVTGTGSYGDESPTSVYIDGVYLAGTPGLYFDLNNIERVEVLKGPQGTLFGRNSVGGSIQIITKTPQYKPHAIVSAEYANYDRIATQFYGTTGLTDTLAIDLAAVYDHQQHGWGRNIFTGAEIYRDNQYAFRSKLLWEPDAATRVVVSGSYSHVGLPTLQGRGILQGRVNIAGVSSNIGFYNVDESINGLETSKQKTASINARHDFGPFTLVSITGYENTVGGIVADQDGSHLTLASLRSESVTKSLTQEIQLVSPSSEKFNWLIGAYLFHAKLAVNQIAVTTQTLINPTVFTTINPRSPVDSYSVFGQTTVEVLPETKLTAGLRYTLDKRSLYGFTGNQLAQIPLVNRHRNDHAFTYRLALSRQMTDQVMAYASASTGFKSGLYPLTAPTAAAAAPSYLHAYEAGFKADVLDNRLRFNLAVFLNKYKSVQVRIRLPDNSGNIFTNATDAEAKGIDLDFNYLASKSLSFRGGLTYLDSKYGAFPNAGCSFPLPSGLGNSSGLCDASGRQTILSPKLVFSFSTNYSMETPVGKITLSATESHNSGSFFDSQNRVATRPFDLVNLSAEWQSLDEALSTRLWVRNALNDKYYTGAQSSGFGDLMNVGTPLTYGVTLKASF